MCLRKLRLAQYCKGLFEKYYTLHDSFHTLLNDSFFHFNNLIFTTRLLHIYYTITTRKTTV